MELIDVSKFGDLQPFEVYMYYDRPLIYSSKINEEFYFVFLWDEEYSSSGIRLSEYYLVKPTNEKELVDLQLNKIKLRDYLRSSFLYFVKFTRHRKYAYKTTAQELDWFDPLAWPDPDVYLYDEPLEKILR